MAIKLTQAGLDALADSGKANFTYLAVGTGSVSFSLGMTAMGTELVRVSATAQVVSSVLTMTAFLNATQGNGSLTEVAGWDASSSGNLLLYGTWSPAEEKDSTSAMLITESITLANIA